MAARITREAKSGETLRAVTKGLRAYNRKAGGRFPHEKVTLSLRDEEGNIVGGLIGEIGWGWLFVHLLWIADAHRGADHGTALIGEAERIGREAGVMGLYLDTATFQAPGFYQKMGFTEVGRIKDRPPGHTTIWFAKRF
jgi:ribosomal protein S18 acetylase RimI-like enzyme